MTATLVPLNHQWATESEAMFTDTATFSKHHQKKVHVRTHMNQTSSGL